MLYIIDVKKQVLQIFLKQLYIQGDNTWIQMGHSNEQLQLTPETIKAATIVVVIVPILLVYPFVQKYFVKGVMLGSVKG